MQTTQISPSAALRAVQQVMVRRKHVVLLVPKDTPDELQVHQKAPATVVASFAENLQSVGYVPSASLYAACEALSLNELEELHNWLMSSLRELRGSKPFNPMYRNFPQEVMQSSKTELYLNAIRHYWTSGKWLPDSVREPRTALGEEGNLTTLTYAGASTAQTEFLRLVSANSAISTSDKEDMRLFVDYFDRAALGLIPEVIPNRENKAHLLSLLLRFGSDGIALAKKHCSTATDVLRLAVALGGGDVSLAEPSKFPSFRRTERRAMLEILEAQNNTAEDMLRWAERWKRLGERLHPGERGALYPKTLDAFKTIREDRALETFNSKIERAFEKRAFGEALALLTARPGDFARRIDHLLRVSNETLRRQILTAFGEIANRVSTPVLFQVMHHFRTREAARGGLFQAIQQVMPRVSAYEPIRVFLPKGAVSKAQVIPNRLPKLPSTICDTVAETCRKTLVARFERLPGLGRCYLDPGLRKFAVPFTQRSASKSLRTIARGSRLPMPNADTLRFFIWWKNGVDRTDLDLSAVALRADFSHHTTVAYYNLKNFGGHHSGDIVDAPEGASEFIDISIARCREQNVRYIAMMVNSFTQQPYCDLPECFAGWMARKDANSGEIYEPRTVCDRLDLGANARIAMPAVFDLETREVLWLDLSLTASPRWANNAAANMSNIQLMLRAFTTRPWPCLYDLLELHVRARGTLVNTETDADTVFSIGNETPFQLERIASEFLAD